MFKHLESVLGNLGSLVLDFWFFHWFCFGFFFDGSRGGLNWSFLGGGGLSCRGGGLSRLVLNDCWSFSLLFLYLFRSCDGYFSRLSLLSLLSFSNRSDICSLFFLWGLNRGNYSLISFRFSRDFLLSLFLLLRFLFLFILLFITGLS
jgi:hypothetical protein